VYKLVRYPFINSVKDMHTMSGADIHFDHNMLVTKMCTRLKKIMRLKNGKPLWIWRSCAQRKENLEAHIGAIESESGNYKVQWDNSNK
jgi:hypothetical protein